MKVVLFAKIHKGLGNYGKHPLWNDEYWLLLIAAVPEEADGREPLILERDGRLESGTTHQLENTCMSRCSSSDWSRLRIKRLWENYADNPQKLASAISALSKHMNGYGNAIRVLYQGVEVKETFRDDWEPLGSEPSLTPREAHHHPLTSTSSSPPSPWCWKHRKSSTWENSSRLSPR